MRTRLIYSTLLIPFLMVISTVFVISPELGNGVVSGKYFWFYISIAIYAVISTIFTVKDRRSIHFSLFDCLIICFGILTLSISYWINHSEAITKHIILLLLILFYFYTKCTIRMQKSNLYWMAVGLLLTCLVESYWGLRQLYGYDHSQHAQFRLTGSFFNPGPYACYLSIISPIAFYYILKGWNCTKVGVKIRYWPIYLRWGVAVLTFAGTILVLPAAMSRASWLAAMGGCGIVILFHVRNSSRLKTFLRVNKTKCILLLSVILLAFLVGCIGMYYLKKDSADGRALIWKTSIQTILHHPMGVGIGNFSGSYGEEQAAYFAAGKGSDQEEFVAGNPEYAFNEYLQICIEQGILPFTLLIVIISYSLYIGIKRKKSAPVVSLVALLIVSAMSYPFSVLPFLIVLAFLLAWIHSEEKGKLIKPQLIAGFAVASLLIVILCLYNRYPTRQAYTKWEKYALMYHSGMYHEAAKEYKHLYPELSDQLTFLFEYAQCLSKSELYKESNQVLEKATRISCDPMLYNIMGKNHQALKQYIKAEDCFTISANIVPNRVYPYYLKALLFIEKGEIEKAKAVAQIVLTKEPKVQSTAIREMRNKMKELINE